MLTGISRLGLDPSSVKGNMQWQQYEPKTWEETDVDIRVTHCGICGSDLHTLRSGWAPSMYPCCVGFVIHRTRTEFATDLAYRHEIVGTAVKVGKKVEKGIK